MNHHDMTNIGIARASNNALKDEVAGLNQYRKALEAKHAALVEAVEIASNLLGEDLAGFDTIEDQIDYIRLRLDTALAAANESLVPQEEA